MGWKVLFIWFLFMACAILNGALREKLIIPFTGEAIGHIISTVLLCVIILCITLYTAPWLAPGTRQRAWAIGACWLLLTLAFEFALGYFIGHHSWSEMLADYNVLRGRVWVAVPIIIFLAPWWMAHLRHLLP